MESIKQTAVKWLQEAISKKLSSEIGPYFLDLFDQAKEIEKEQIEDAYCNGFFDAWDNPTYKEVQRPESAEQYYNEQYGDKK